MQKRKFLIISLFMGIVSAFCANEAAAQYLYQPKNNEKEGLTEGLTVTAEAQASVSNGYTPLWLNANKYGLSSLEETNGYLRVSAIRPAETDKRKWKWGYGADVAVAANYTSTVVIQQLYGEMEWKKVHLTLGSKQQPMELIDKSAQDLSTGALLFGINSRPIPQARLDVDWFSIPGTRGWWKWKFHGSFGMTTDGKWQEDFSNSDVRYTNNTLYHQKGLYWKFGKEDPDQIPLTFELGLQLATQFGGKTYNAYGRGLNNEKPTIEHPQNLQAVWDALTCGGSDVTDGVDKNTAGNQFGSWIGRIMWHGYDWSAALRFERFFEDQSMMFFQYGIQDHLLGVDVTVLPNPYVTSITIEHMNSRNQSGPVYHDPTANLADKMAGIDNYYNHNLYSGAQHWGQAMGNPLFTSPIYNSYHYIYFYNNRIRAWHLGLSGDPNLWIHWRFLATYSQNWGTYYIPMDQETDQCYLMGECTVAPPKLKGWSATLGIAYDGGDVVGRNVGAQLTIRKTLFAR